MTYGLTPTQRAALLVIQELKARLRQISGTQIAVGYLITLVGLAIMALIYGSIALVLLALFGGAIWLVIHIVWAAAYVVIAALALSAAIVLVGVFAK